MKKRINITIDKEIHEKAQKLGINISKACEYCLRQYVEALEGKNYVFIHTKNGGKK